MNSLDRLKSNNKIVIWIILIIVFAFIPLFTGGYYTSFFLLVFLYATLGQMWNFLASNMGAISLGQQIFIGMGGYLVALSTIKWGLPIFAGAILGVLVSLGIAALISYPFFRLKGIYFAIGTWMASAVIYSLFRTWDYIGAASGLKITASYDLSYTEIYYPALILSLISIFFSWYLLRSKIGYGLRAIGDVDSITPAMGINKFRLQQLAFCFAAVITAVAGSLYFLYSPYITPSSALQISWIIPLIFVTVVGGIGMPAGPLFGSFVLMAMRDALQAHPDIYLLAQGIVIVGVVLALPQGILGLIKEKLGFEVLSIKEEA